MNKRLFFLLYTLLTVTCTYAQQADPVAIRINGQPVYKSELAEAFRKSNELRPFDEKESINDFAQSYAGFRMNLEEAKVQRLDTLLSYRTDLAAARVQMARTYLDNDQLILDYAKEIYNRMLQDVEVNHVLIPFEGEVVLPSDTLALYRKALAVRDEIIKNNFTGEDYRPRGSQWTSIAMNGEQRNGYVGWVSPFMFSSRIEDAIYSLPLREVSMPIRTPSGYHIVQVLNKRPAAGTAEVEQVVFGFLNIPPLQHQIDSVSKVAWREYRNIRSQEDFQSLCDEFSEVHQTGDKGCYFGKVNLESLNPSSFNYAALSLKKPGDISEPVLTDYGFHIIRLRNKIPVPEYDEIKDGLLKKIVSKGRMSVFNDDHRKDMFSKVNLKINDVAYDELKNIAERFSPVDSAFQQQIAETEAILYTLDDSVRVQVSDFVSYMAFRQKQSKPSDDPAHNLNRSVDAIKFTLSSDVLNEYFNAYLFDHVTTYYYKTLPAREPEYRKQLDEFADGLLLFTVKNKNIWERAGNDKEGLQQVFARNKEKYKLDGERYKGVILFAKNKQALKNAEAQLRDAADLQSFARWLRTTLNKDSVAVIAEPGLWAKGDNAFVDSSAFGGEQPQPRKGFPEYAVVGKLISLPEEYSDVKNQVEADYSDLLEKQWDAYLKEKYTVEIDQSVLNTIR